ncbi:MAG: pre-peptidase C-terminal domain-containing protein [Anaerolineae bacterium]|nr:pre-peptidase C-terminal domain-containing protein [Anaerolineae bacterium]
MSEVEGRRPKQLLLRASAASGAALFVLLALLLLLRAAPSSAVSLPDLVVESITIEPPIPDPGQQFTITFRVRNQGTAATVNFNFPDYIYVDPVDQPPVEGTPYTRWENNTYLAPGAFFQLTRSDPKYVFTTTGCDHVIYVWADATDVEAESDETNNLLALPVCVGVTCDPDSYEEDNSCAAARWLTEGAPQAHTLCPTGDEDWAKFTAIGGVTYTIEATNLGAHADPRLYLYETCGGLYQFGTGPSIEWQAPASGVYYLQVEDHLTTHGPLANYDLVLATSGGAGDFYEPDDTCATARDIPTDGTRQAHLFQAAGDQDWVKFTIGSGETFAVVADNTGPGAVPLVSLYSGCGQALGEFVDQSGPLTTTAATGQTYYAKVANQDPESYGPEVGYDLRVSVVPCVSDGYEPDNNAAAASEIPTTGTPQTHDICPTGDQDWVWFDAEAGMTYVLHTSNLGFAADTHLYLYDTDGQTELAHNDDYGYLVSSRIIWVAPASGTYYAKVQHHNPIASGPATHYDLAISKGVCTLDAHEPDNGTFDAPVLVTDGEAQTHTFCADPALSGVGDQDWVRFEALGGASYLIQTANLGPNSDTVLNLYASDRSTLLASNDDHGAGTSSSISVTIPADGTYYLQVIHYNSTVFGDDTGYDLSVSGDIPTPTPTPTPSPTPSPTPPPTPGDTDVRTLIVVNTERVSSLYGASEADALLSKLYELADHDSVDGAVLQVEDDASVAAAYDAWTADPASLIDPAKANDVASAVRNLLLTFLNANANMEYIVIVGNDLVIPFRRAPEGALSVQENAYASSLASNTPQQAALENNMVLTDDYYGDREPTTWQGGELYIPDYAIGRLVEQPGQIADVIDLFLSNDVIDVENALVTGYDFVQDTAVLVSTLLNNDELETDDELIGISWSGDAFRDRQLYASPRFDLQSINGHANHTSSGAPDGDDIQAGEIVTATSDLAGALVFSVGCHAGLNDSNSLDLPEAFAIQGANYVANTGYGWGGGGIVYSEALMRNYAYELLVGTQTQIGKALTAAKQRYYASDQVFNAYDAKVLMQATMYGLPMYTILSGGTFSPGDPFPSVSVTSTAPIAFGEVNEGLLSFGAGAFGETETGEGTFLDVDGWSHFAAGEPVQPSFYVDIHNPEAGDLHGVLFLGGTYTDIQGFDPVIALSYNEYVTSTAEPAFSAPGWYPTLPVRLQASASVSDTTETVYATLGQYDSASATERVYGAVALGTLYSASPDTQPPTIQHVDGVLLGNPAVVQIKVEAADASGIIRVVVAYTEGGGTWASSDLTYDAGMGKWTGTIPGTAGMRHFVQVVDGAGNVSVDDRKGQYHVLLAPLPLIEGSGSKVYLPVLLRGG